MWKSIKKLFGALADVTAASADVAREQSVKLVHVAKEESAKGYEVAREQSVILAGKAKEQSVVAKDAFVRIGDKLVVLSADASKKLEQRIDYAAARAAAWRHERTIRHLGDTDGDVTGVVCTQCHSHFATLVVNDVPVSQQCSQECHEAFLQDLVEGNVGPLCSSCGCITKKVLSQWVCAQCGNREFVD